MGVAVFAPGVGIEECIRQADQALYEGKRAGKDRVVAASLPVAGSAPLQG